MVVAVGFRFDWTLSKLCGGGGGGVAGLTRVESKNVGMSTGPMTDARGISVGLYIGL